MSRDRPRTRLECTVTKLPCLTYGVRASIVTVTQFPKLSREVLAFENGFTLRLQFRKFVAIQQKYNRLTEMEFSKDFD
jgi:hypothetical protein